MSILFTENHTHAVEPALVTPPPKRGRGRPPRIIEPPKGTPSQAAISSAAMLKQGTPKAAPLMRISPNSRRTSYSNISSSPVNPSPKGGLLLKLTDAGMDENSTKKSPPKSNKGRRLSSTYVMKTNGISLQSQHKLQSLVTDPMNANPFGDISVNPSLLLSSPISAKSDKHSELELFKAPEQIPQRSRPVYTQQMPSNLLNVEPGVSSSPMTPNSASSRHFSSMMQSSPMYSGYYMEQSSPNTSIINSSPVRFHIKPFDLKKSLPELPKNPCNSPSESRRSSPKPPSSRSKQNANNSKLKNCISKPSRSSTPQSGLETKKFIISLQIDETGQAQITKTPITPMSTTPSPKSSSSINKNFELKNKIFKTQALTRHHSLISIHQQSPSRPSLARSQSTLVPSSESYDVFLETSKMSNDSFFHQVQEMTSKEALESLVSESTFDVFNEDENLIVSDESNEEFNDGQFEEENLSFDARRALIQVMRRGL